jgi:phospholipid/cholesterol/gamma-HCH transport system substrate-binding protein
VDVGKVNHIEFDPENPGQILVGIDVKAGTPITRGTFAQLGSQGVTGLAYVMLDDDGKKPEPLPPSGARKDRIPVRQAFLDQLSGSGKDVLAEVSEVGRRLNALLDGKNQAQLMRTLASLETATQGITTLAHQLEPGMKGFSALTADARKTLQRADTLLVNLNTLTQQLSQRADTLERVAKSAEQMGGSAQSLSNAALTESLPRISTLLDELARNSRNLDQLLSNLNDQPSSLVFGRVPPAPGPGEPEFDPQRRSNR